MSFQPIIPASGYAGWAFLNRTRAVQQEAFENSPAMARDVAYFKDNIGKISTAQDLVADRRLLQVALGAFGLGEDINNKYFLQKVLEDGTIETDALANRLSDKRYLSFSKAFGFGDFDTPRTVLSDFGDEITTAYKNAQFEAAVGDQDQNMRLAMGLDRALKDIADLSTTDNGRWYTVMGQPPVRTVFETALGLPKSIGALDLEQQLVAFREKASTRFGNGEVSQFADPEKRQELVRLFLLRADISGPSSGTTGSSTALTLLQNANGYASGLFGIIA
jgi:hypothetical protein